MEGRGIRAGCKTLWTIFKRVFIRPVPRVNSHDRLIIFGRCPAPGRTKTRLIPALGELGAAELHRRLTETTVARIEVSFCGGSRRKMQRWLGADLLYRHQCEGDLGLRMERAFLHAFEAGGDRIVLIGTDVPGFTQDHLRQAFDALTGHDLVLGPTTDGGYWLIGMHRPARLFHGIDWSTDRVLKQTLDMASDHGLSVSLLEPLSDVDRPEDLSVLPVALRPAGPIISVIIPALNEAEGIEASICSAQCNGTEVIVVDGGSTDETASIAESSRAKVLLSPPGRANQMNLGAENARGRVLLFLHADTVLPKDFAALIFEALLDRMVPGGAHRMKTDASGVGMFVLDWLANLRTRCLSLPYGDQAIFVRRRVFDALGGFPDVRIAEDLFFMQRLRLCGLVAVLPLCATTSGRRWEGKGLLRGLLINQLIAIGCWLSLPSNWLARLHQE